MGIGVKRTSHLREKVAALTPITGIQASAATPHVAVDH